MKKVITGNEAAAYACMQAGVQVVAAYPITPQTTVVEKIADFVGQGIFDAQYVKVESEHSAMAACIAASNTGVRTFTATSSHGLLLMHEMLHWAMAARVPVVMSNVNRANGPPWSVWAEHSDSIAQRDTGWLQFYAENNQEVLDTLLMCYRLCEQEDILLPAFVNEDAFILSHTSEVVDIPDREDVKKFLPDFDPPYKLDPDDPHGFGSLSMPHQWYMELRYNIADAMDKAYGRFPQVEKEFEEVFGRNHGGILDEYRTEGAEHVLVCAGTVASTAKEVVDQMRSEGKNVGLARLRMLRPFPVNEFRALGTRVSALGVMDRAYSFGYEGPFFTEIKGALYDLPERPAMKNYIMGIGGRDITTAHIRALFDDLEKVAAGDRGGKEVEWIDLKGKQVAPRWGVK